MYEQSAPTTCVEERRVNVLTSFDGIQIAYHDEGEGPTVILLHGFGVDGLGQFGNY